MFSVVFKRTVSSLSGFIRVSVSVQNCKYSTIDMTSLHPIVMSGPSGGGKSTLLTRIMNEFPDCFAFSVSHTTRNPRPGEKEGKDYFYVTRPVFEKMIDEGGFLEHAEFSGNRYGTSKKAVELIQKTGRICVLDLEVNGVKNIKKTNLNARYVFVKPPSMDVLIERLKSRGTESEESLKKRIDSAKESMDYADQIGSYDHIVVNDNLDVAYEYFKGLLIGDINTLQQERLKATK